MQESTIWQNQDYLKLTVQQWCGFLQDPSIFDENALRMVQFVYRQMNHTSTASDIAAAFSTNKVTVHHNQITAWNRKIAKMIYNHCNVAPPVDFKGEKRYWNVVFDGNPEHPTDQNGHYYWILRPNLVTAMQLLALDP